MNADATLPDMIECARFAAFWCEATGLPHLTLTAITPDGATTTATFQRGESHKLCDWIARAQSAGRNVYFQPNETPAGCVSKAAKQHMVAAVCRHADIDPADELAPLAEERERLARLADMLAADPVMPPTAIIDSGNGMQPLWAVAREALAGDVVERIEGENRTVEAALGAFATHDVSRLLRLPGTVNFPNEKKRSRGRGISRARLVHALPRCYRADEAAVLGDHLAVLLAGSPLVRAPVKTKARGPKDTGAAGDGNPIPDRSNIAFRKGAALRRAGATFDAMCEALADDPETADWVRDKGHPNNSRELRRIWEKAAPAAPDMTVLRLNRRDPPPFPIAVLGDGWAPWTRVTAEAAACPIDNVAAPLLACASALIGNARWAQATPGWAEPPHLWMGVVGDSGTGKSPGADALMRDVIPELERRMQDGFPERLAQHRATVELHAAAIERWKADVRTADSKRTPPPMPPSGEPPAAPQAPTTTPGGNSGSKLMAGGPTGWNARSIPSRSSFRGSPWR
jgi:hypothetical protein